jgi:hypothetical protein
MLRVMGCSRRLAQWSTPQQRLARDTNQGAREVLEVNVNPQEEREGRQEEEGLT